MLIRCGCLLIGGLLAAGFLFWIIVIRFTGGGF